MVEKVYYAYGDHCCLHIFSDDRNQTIEQAVKEGYGFIVKYEERSKASFPHRTILAWNARVLTYEEALKSVKDNTYLLALYVGGYNTFIKAPLPDGDFEVFPFADFEAFKKISLDV